MVNYMISPGNQTMQWASTTSHAGGTLRSVEVDCSKTPDLRHQFVAYRQLAQIVETGTCEVLARWYE